ncbi:MAG: DUF2273 domain-containing protein [Desulfosporosinus sp.]|nr:DUF2273 domain-containing protein [Desulfosporosinus sp.]
MNGFWSKIEENISRFLVWAIGNHPGKLIGTAVGFFLGLLMVTLGFWRTLVLFLFVVLGFVLGKSQDDHENITAWLERILSKY